MNSPQAVQSILRLDNISRVYKSGSSDLTVLDGVNLDIVPGRLSASSAHQARVNHRCCMRQACWNVRPLAMCGSTANRAGI
jgi:hypothetical protein